MATGNALLHKDEVLYAESVVINGNTLTGTELGYLDGITLGTLAASKAWTSDSSLDTVMPTGGKLTVQSGGDITLESGSTLDVAGTFEIANVAMTASAAELNYNDIATLGTLAASKAWTSDSSLDTVMPTGGLLTVQSGGAITMASGSTLTVMGTGQNVLSAAGSTLAVTAALHAGGIVKLDTATGSVCTLPAATGTGDVYRFMVTVTPTSNSHIVKVSAAGQYLRGGVMVVDEADGTATSFGCLVGNGTTTHSDTVTLNRTTTGAVGTGDMLTFVDVATGYWNVSGTVIGTGAEANPFSATV